MTGAGRSALPVRNAEWRAWRGAGDINFTLDLQYADPAC